jgi:hypothetical protein
MAAIPRALRLHRGRLAEDDVEAIEGVRVTTPLRTLVDVIVVGQIATELQIQAVQEALRRGLVTLRQFDLVQTSRRARQRINTVLRQVPDGDSTPVHGRGLPGRTRNAPARAVGATPLTSSTSRPPREARRVDHGRRSRQEVKDELIAIGARRDELERQLAAADHAPPLLPNMADLYMPEKVAGGEASTPETRSEATETLRGLIDEITLTPVDGTLQIELKGNLAAMLGAAQNAKRSPETGDLSLQIAFCGGVQPAALQLWFRLRSGIGRLSPTSHRAGENTRAALSAFRRLLKSRSCGIASAATSFRFRSFAEVKLDAAEISRPCTASRQIPPRRQRATMRRDSRPRRASWATSGLHESCAVVGTHRHVSDVCPVFAHTPAKDESLSRSDCHLGIRPTGKDVLQLSAEVLPPRRGRASSTLLL